MKRIKLTDPMKCIKLTDTPKPAIDLAEVAAWLGGTVVAKVEARGGYFGALALAQVVAERRRDMSVERPASDYIILDRVKLVAVLTDMVADRTQANKPDAVELLQDLLCSLGHPGALQPTEITPWTQRRLAVKKLDDRPKQQFEDRVFAAHLHTFLEHLLERDAVNQNAVEAAYDQLFVCVEDAELRGKALGSLKQAYELLGKLLEKLDRGEDPVSP